MSKESGNNYLYIFPHIPKNAGTTLRQHFRRCFRDGEVLYLYSELNPTFKTRAGVEAFIKLLGPERRGKVKVIIGHCVYYGLEKLFQRPARYVGIFRNPVDRSVSLYNYFLTEFKQGRLIDEEKLIQNKTIIAPEVFLGGEIVHNAQFRFLRERHFISSDQNDDELAIDFALKKFYFLGLVENSKKDFLTICRILEINPFVVSNNRSKKFLKPVQLASLEKIIEANNSLDNLLYAKVKEAKSVLEKSFVVSGVLAERSKIELLYDGILSLPLAARYRLADFLKNNFRFYSRLLAKRNNDY